MPSSSRNLLPAVALLLLMTASSSLSSSPSIQVATASASAATAFIPHSLAARQVVSRPLCGVDDRLMGGRRVGKVKKSRMVMKEGEGGGGGNKWASPGVDDFGQRIESVKTAVLAGVSGSVASVPCGLLFDVILSPAYGATGSGVAQWEYDTDMISIESALLGIVYRYAIRQDDNPQLKSGVVGAFALTRALSLVKTTSTCLSVPLRCGPPLEYLDWTMACTLAAGLVTSFVAFGAAAKAVEVGFEKGLVKKFP